VKVGEAVRQAVEALGVPAFDNGLSPEQLKDLSDAYDAVVRETAAYKAKKWAAKIAKDSLKSATELLLGKVKTFTHPAPLPLFEAAKEADAVAQMVAGTDSSEAVQPVA
jgi:hypothetical protein